MIQVDSNDLEKNMKKDKKTSLKKIPFTMGKTVRFSKNQYFLYKHKTVNDEMHEI